jgi:beta-glucosidase/6-phospho-beta-glucosidase/beta-galactosidase
MRQRLGSDLPTFSETDKEFIRNKIDFVGLNHYTSRFIAHHQNPKDIYFYQVQQVERLGMIPCRCSLPELSLINIGPVWHSSASPVELFFKKTTP